MNAMKQTGVSLYYQVAENIKKKIDSGEWPRGSRLPSEPELTALFRVSRSTIRQAISVLVKDGLLIRKQGSGTYVTVPAYARERLVAMPSETVCRYIYEPILADDVKYSFQNMIWLNIAHVLMMYKQEILNGDDARKLLTALKELSGRSPEVVGTVPYLEDYYLNFEQYIISQLGLEVGGKLHTARSRNDLVPTLMRMNVRDAAELIYPRVLELRHVLLELAEANLDLIVTGYTHLQPAQPITLGHYFLAVAEALSRDFTRLLSAYHTLNRSPLGGCAFAGTAFPIDRDYTARLLGFEGLIQNSLDAVSARDYLLELSSDFSTLGSTLCRFAEDLYLWSTDEFGYLEFSDSVSCCSSIMPQKKNPLSIEHVKSKTAHLTSTYLDICMCLKGTPYGHCRDLFECMPPFWDAVWQLQGILDLLTETLKTMTINQQRMLERAEENYSTLSDLVDALVQTEDIPFRVAHKIVGATVRNCIAQGLHPKDIRVEMLNEVAQQQISQHFRISQSELEHILSAEYAVSNKKSSGSPSHSSCLQMLKSMTAALDGDEASFFALTNHLQMAKWLVQQELSKLLPAAEPSSQPLS